MTTQDRQSSMSEEKQSNRQDNPRTGKENELEEDSNSARLKRRRAIQMEQQEQAKDHLRKRKKKSRHKADQVKEQEGNEPKTNKRSKSKKKSKSKASIKKQNLSSSEECQQNSKQSKSKYKKRKQNAKSDQIQKSKSKDRQKSLKKKKKQKLQAEVSKSKQKNKANSQQNVPTEKVQKKKPKGYVYKPPKPKPIQKQESINEIMRQYSKISRKKKRKSNFYLDKIDSRKWGEPVGRGAKKIRQKMEIMNNKKKQLEKKRKKQQKKERERYLNSQKQPKGIKLQSVISSDSSDSSDAQQSEAENVKLENSQNCLNPHFTPLSKQQRRKPNLQFSISKYVIQKLIDLYTVNAFDYAVISKQLPQLSLFQIRCNLKVVFLRCFEKIQSKFMKKCGQKITVLSQTEKSILVNQFYLIKSKNRLLISNDNQFNQLFNKTLYSLLNPDIEFESKEARLLWDKILQFVRPTIEKSDKIKQGDILCLDSEEEIIKQQHEDLPLLKQEQKLSCELMNASPETIEEQLSAKDSLDLSVKQKSFEGNKNSKQL